MRKRRRRLTGLLYLAPALAFVLAFTAWPFAQMVWMSLNNWSLIAQRKFIGTANFVKAWNDPQFWEVARVHLQVHRCHHAVLDGDRVCWSRC